jgi:hypothetical protein
MNKEDILLRSQMENSDEGEENAENQGRAWGLVALAVVFCIIIIFNMVFCRNNTAASCAASAMFWAYLSMSYLPKYRFTRKRSMLVSSVAAAIASIASLLSYILMVIK